MILLIGLLAAWEAVGKKKRSKLQDLLAKKEENDNRIKVERAKDNKAMEIKEKSKLSPGYHVGLVASNRFFYNKLHGVMTPKEAVLLCEQNPACGGFTFNGPKVDGYKVFVYFYHFIPHDGLVTDSMETALWTTYRASKKYIVLPGKPLIERQNVSSDVTARCK